MSVGSSEARLQSSIARVPSPLHNPETFLRSWPVHVNMNRGAGLAAFERSQTQSSKYHEVGESILSTHAEQLRTQLDVFKAALTEFAKGHSEDIRSNSEFRNAFVRMCSIIGVDPLISSSNKKSSVWAELLGRSVNDFYFGLALRIIEVARKTRAENGGFIDIDKVREYIQKEDNESGREHSISE